MPIFGDNDFFRFVRALRNLESKVGTLKLIQSSNFLAFYTSIDQNNGKKSRNWELSNFFDF